MNNVQTFNAFNSSTNSLTSSKNANSDVTLDLEFDFALCHSYYSYCCWH
jgi:hypothetical protein